MQNLSEFQIIGHVGAIKSVGSTLRVNIAANYPSRDDTGQRQDRVYWNEITIFADNTKNYVRKYVAKGDLVHARGRIGQHSYERDGERIYTVDLIAHSFGLLASKNHRGDSDQGEHGDADQSEQGSPDHYDEQGADDNAQPYPAKTRATRKRAA